MSKVQVDKVVNLSDDGAPQLTYGAELPVGYGLTGAGGLNITGVVTAASAVFSGNVTIGGTLTYEDVTNIDVVGVSTFAGRMNVNSSALFNEGLSVTAGVTTIAGTSTFAKKTTINATLEATEGLNVTNGIGTFSGSIYMADKLRHLGDTDTNIRFPSADTITAETGGTERIRITSDGDILLGTDQATIGNNTSDGSDNRSFSLCGGSDASQNRGSLVGLFGNEHASFPGTLALRAGNVTGGRIEFSASGSEKMRLDENGRLLLGTTTEGFSSGDDLTIATSSHTGITIRSGTTSEGAVYFSDASSGAGEYIASLVYSHNTDAMMLTTNGSERLRIDSSGRLIIGHNASTGEARALQIVGTTADKASVQLIKHSADVSGSKLDLTKSRNGTIGSNTIVQDDDNLGEICWRGDDGTNLNTEGARIAAYVDGGPGANDMPGRLVFETTANGSNSPTERLRIDSSGRIIMGAVFTAGDAGYYDDITINNSNTTSGEAGGTGITLLSGSSSWGALLFGDTDDNDAGAVKYSHADNRIVINTSGNNRVLIDSDGLKFGSNTAAANALDSYEKGDFTVVCKNSVTLHGTSDQAAYIKIGNLCHVQGQLHINSSNSNSDFIINNLPFTATNPTDSGGHSVGAVRLYGIDAPTGTIGPFCIVYDGGTELAFRTSKDNAVDTALTATDGGYFAFSITYRTVAS